MVARSVGGVGSTGAWAISLHKDEVIAELAARYRPAIAADQADPQAGERWERWLRAPLPDAATRWRLWETDPRGEAYQSVVEFDLLTAAGRQWKTRATATARTTMTPTSAWQSECGARQPDPQAMYFACQSQGPAAGVILSRQRRPARCGLPGWRGSFS